MTQARVAVGRLKILIEHHDILAVKQHDISLMDLADIFVRRCQVLRQFVVFLVAMEFCKRLGQRQLLPQLGSSLRVSPL